jgi:hypothetical protein
MWPIRLPHHITAVIVMHILVKNTNWWWSNVSSPQLFLQRTIATDAFVLLQNSNNFTSERPTIFPIAFLGRNIIRKRKHFSSERPSSNINANPIHRNALNREKSNDFQVQRLSSSINSCRCPVFHKNAMKTGANVFSPNPSIPIDCLSMEPHAQNKKK